MKSLLRPLLVLLLMLALPFQAFASAGMLPRVAAVATVQTAPALPLAAAGMHPAPAAVHPLADAGLPPCHRQPAQQQQRQQAATPHAPAADPCHASPHDKGQCGTCAACCVGAAIAASLPAVAPAAPPAAVAIPFRAGHLPSVDPVLPERPPSTPLA